MIGNLPMHPDSSPKPHSLSIAFFKKLAVFLGWFPLTLFTLAAAFFVLTLLNQMPENTLPFNISYPYSLFSSLPGRGEVLGSSIQAQDARPELLLDFLRFYKSPMASLEVAQKMAETADACPSLPWTWLAAIAGKESGFGKVVPAGSYNAWGWAVYTGQAKGVDFTSWEDGVEKVGQGLCDYTQRGVDTVEELEAYYTPLSAASHHGWRDGVNFFVWQLENWQM